MLNQSKGPAVHSLRAQADKQEYTRQMRRTMENTDHLTIRQGEVAELIVEEGQIKGLKTYSGATYYCKAVVLATGTYLKARCIYGDVSNPTGPNGLQAANHLTDSLKSWESRCSVSRRAHRRVSISAASIFLRWKSSSAMRGLCHFLFHRSGVGAEGAGVLLADLYQ